MGDMQAEQPTGKKPFPWVIAILIGVGCLFVGIAVLGILAALLLPALAQARHQAKTVDCKNNLRQLGVYLVTYTSRYGHDTHYPPAPGHEFWETLWAAPDPSQSVAPRPMNSSTFLCGTYGSASGRSSAALDYTSPRFENTRRFPGGLLTDRVRADQPLGGDIVTGADPNHGSADRDFNMLRFDGSVQRVQPGTQTAKDYEESTTGERVP